MSVKSTNAYVGVVDSSGNEIDSTNPMPTSLATSLSSEYDSIDVNKMSKGSVTTAHSAITGTATSAEIDCRGFNAGEINFEITASTGTWTIALLGCPITGGTFVPVYDANNALISFAGVDSSRSLTIPIIASNYIKIVATETAGTATVTIKFTPMV